MASSALGDETASVGRDDFAAGPPPGYRFLLPTVPSGEGMKLCVILHGDLSARPYRVEDFRSPFEDAGLLKAVTGIGAYQMGHVWLVGMRTQEEKEALLAKGSLKVKGRYCAVINPTKQEVTFKVHWVPFFLSNEALRRAFSEFGEIKDVRQDSWNASTGFSQATSTTRVVQAMLNEGTTPDALPHLFKVNGEPVLVVVPGRAPVCLRCRRSGHIRRDCRTPRCYQCHAFGHERRDCVRSYASVTGDSGSADVREDLMTEEEAERTSPAGGGDAHITARINDGDLNEGKTEATDGQRKPDSAEHVSTEAAAADREDEPEDMTTENENGSEDEQAATNDGAEAPPKRRRNEGTVVTVASAEQKLREAERKWLLAGRGGRAFPEGRVVKTSVARGGKPRK